MSDDFFRAYLKSKAGLSDEALNELKSTYSVKNYNKGDLIKAQGDYSSIYFVQNGLLRLFGVDENAKEHILQFIDNPSLAIFIPVVIRLGDVPITW